MLLNILEVCLRIMIMIINNNVDDKGNMARSTTYMRSPWVTSMTIIIIF